jgi:hypothetical protein
VCPPVALPWSGLHQVSRAECLPTSECPTADRWDCSPRSTTTSMRSARSSLPESNAARTCHVSPRGRCKQPARKEPTYARPEGRTCTNPRPDEPPATVREVIQRTSPPNDEPTEVSTARTRPSFHSPDTREYPPPGQTRHMIRQPEPPSSSNPRATRHVAAMLPPRHRCRSEELPRLARPRPESRCLARLGAAPRKRVTEQRTRREQTRRLARVR